jgi:FtsZ-binding cell division protein ZapB
LRKENAALADKLAAALADREAAAESAAHAQEQTGALVKEIESLRAERKQVRSRIEKLLGQMDLLSQT